MIKMSRRGDNIHKRTDGRWEGRYKSGVKPNGKIRYSSVYAHSYTECKRRLEAAKKLCIPKRACDTTFSDIIDKWLESKRMCMKLATYTKYSGLINTHIKPSLGNIKISQINVDMINAFLREKTEKGSVKKHAPLSASYVRTMSIIISSAIKYSSDERLTSQLKSIYKPIISKKAISSISRECEARLMKALVSENSTVAIGTMLGLQMGLRIGEICALKWECVDLENNMIRIESSVVRVNSGLEKPKSILILDTPKTSSSIRQIPIPNGLKKLLADKFLSRKSDFVVSDKDGFCGTRVFDYKYRSLLKKHNLPNYNFHLLRHTFATRCAESGMDAKTLSVLLGHSTASISLNVYVHPSVQVMKEYLDFIYDSTSINGQINGQQTRKIALKGQKNGIV